MAQLYFRYGAMNSGKSTALLQAAFNYEERGMRVLVAKPAVDTKGADQIVSRLGVVRTVDFLVLEGSSLRESFQQRASGRDPYSLVPDMDAASQPVSCLLIDEAQFLTVEQVDDALRIAVIDDVPVLAYGIRTDFRTRSFPGARRLFELAHNIEELKTICRCGRKALFNTRKLGDRFVFDGDQVAIDDDDGSQHTNVTYVSLCARCYLQERDEHGVADLS
ncbi:thymidine kinase [Auritidibacter ignavus]|uniref:thymidine kinase n=1 Tax=Auritidibacter ignavus TaxID=678932 RepID=UPI002446D5F2|nr:thymidine kinase [Auritidibacter ignavus]WGH82968.1 thymidine kinase [Auritidibacter ignavus]